MKCSVCGAEMGADEKICRQCGASVEEKEAGKEPGSVSGGEVTEGSRDPEEFSQVMSDVQEAAGGADAGAVQPEFPEQGGASAQPEKAGTEPGSGKKKGIIIGAAVAVAAVGALAFGLMGRKDPKEVVINAFENIYTDDQVKPMEELFGVSQFAENALTADIEDSISLILDDCSEAEIKAWAGSGLRISAMSDKTNKIDAADIAVIYKDMELANVQAYYGDETLMMAIPQLSSKVFTLDLSDGLADRVENSPLVGPALEASGMDIQGLFGYLQEQMDRVEAGETGTLDFDSLMTRYREGTQSQEKFKEALSVEKGEKGTFTVDGEETACKGYNVLVSKDSMMEFLRSTTDFFLNDQELKDQFLSQLQQSVRLTELMGGVDSGLSADQMYADSMEEITDAVNEMIDFLDKSLTDVNMTVYVDKKGRLAAVDGSTVLLDPDSAGGTEQESVETEFSFRLQGGSYLTQNMTAEVLLKQDETQITLSMVKNGTYDGKQLTGDLAFDVSLEGSDTYKAGVTCTGTYNSDGGDYHMGLAVTQEDSMLADISVSGVIDQLEKGISLHADIDEVKVTVMDAMAQVTLSGEYSYSPLEGEVTKPDGEAFDIIEAGEEEWQGVIMEVYMNVMQLASQLSF